MRKRRFKGASLTYGTKIDFTVIIDAWKNEKHSRA